MEEGKQRALDDYLYMWSLSALDYKSTDCVRFACGWAGIQVEACWNDESSALRALVKDFGCKRLSDAVNLVMAEEIPIEAARYGDIVAQDQAPLDPLGICLGRESVFLGAGGLVRVKTRKCFRSWSHGKCLTQLLQSQRQSQMSCSR